MRELLMAIGASSLVFVLIIQMAQIWLECCTGGIPEEEAEDEPRW